LSTSVPSSLAEGTKVTLNGAASSPSAEDNAAGFTYSWIVTKDGNPFGGGSSTSVSFTVDDEATFQATFQATDDGGQTNSAVAKITGGEVIPVAHITLVQPQQALVLTANEPVNFAGTFTDSGTVDTDTQTWSFGDGGAASGPSATHSFTAAGTYTVTYAVEDDDHARGTASTTVTVQTPQQALNSISAFIQNIKTLNAGQKNSLMAKLNAASDSTSRGNTNAANNQLNALLNELQAYVSTGKISTGDAGTLRSAVHAVQAALGTYNRFLEWWPLG
jgi:chitodextrinase